MDEQLIAALKEMEDALKKNHAEGFEPILKRLDSLEERDTAADDQKVIDLEKRLIDEEKKREALQEQIRLMQAGNPDSGDSTSNGKPDFKGWFINDVEETRNALAAYRSGSVRAIDTALFTGSIGEGAGALNIETADAFIDMLTDQSETLRRVTTRRMNAPSAAIDELRVSDRTIIAATEGTAPSVADSVTPVRRQLSVVESILAEDITLSFLEDNIARAGAENAIAAQLARGYGNQLNDLFLNGDTTTGTFLVINDGIVVLALADGDVSDVSLAGDAADAALSTCLKTMPARFRSLPDLGFIINTTHAQAYADAVAARATSLGDEVLVNGFPSLRYFGRPVIPDGHMKESTVGILSDRSVILTALSNMVHGVQRAFTVDAQWNPRKRVVEYTMTARTDAQYATGQPFVLGNTLDAALRGS